MSKPIDQFKPDLDGGITLESFARDILGPAAARAASCDSYAVGYVDGWEAAMKERRGWFARLFSHKL